MKTLSGRNLWIIMLCAAAAFSAGYLLQFHLSESAMFKEMLPNIQTEKKETIDKMVSYQRTAQAPVIVSSIVWFVIGLVLAFAGTQAHTARQHTRKWALASIASGIAIGMTIFHFSAEALSPHSFPRYNPEYMAIIVASVIILAGVPLFFIFGKIDRIGRARYVVGMAVLIVVGHATVLVSHSLLSIWAVVVLMQVLCVPLVVARFRDLGRPGWHYFLLLVPFYGFPYLGLCLIVKKGVMQNHSTHFP